MKDLFDKKYLSMRRQDLEKGVIITEKIVGKRARMDIKKEDLITWSKLIY